MSSTPILDIAFDARARRHSLNVLLRDLPAATEIAPDTAIISIRMRMEQVSGALAFLDAGEQALAREWMSAARQAIEQHQVRVA